MYAEKKPSVLVCVTGQYDCERLILKGYEKAIKKGLDLHVLCIHTPVSNIGFMSEEIEYLYQKAKSLGADMTIMFNQNAPLCTADFARRINAKALVTGMPDNRPNGFVVTVHELLPKLQITMVTKNNECLTYSVDYTNKTFA